MYIKDITLICNIIHHKKLNIYINGVVITEISSGRQELRIVNTEKQSFMAQGLTPQHSKRVKTMQNGQKIKKRYAPTGRAHARTQHLRT
jgi:hypothetical protein